MTEEEILAAVKRHADYTLSQGYSAMHTDEALEKSIMKDMTTHGEDLPESTQLLLLSLLVVFEVRRREVRCHSATH